MTPLAIFIVAIFVLIAFTARSPRYAPATPLEIEIVRPRFQCMCVSGMVQWNCPECQDAIRRDDFDYVCERCHAMQPQTLDDVLVRLP